MRISSGSTRLCIALTLALLLVPVWLQAGPPEGQDPGHMYAVNLSSSLKPVDWDKLPRIDALGEHFLYETVYTTPTKVWHRLRMGFFPDRKAAASAMGPLIKAFPGAWVTKVSPSERKAAEGLAVLLPPRVPEPKAAAVQPAPPPVEPPPVQDSAALVLEMAGLAMTRGEYEAAAGYYKEVLKAPGAELDAEAQEGLGRAYELGGKSARARAEYKTYLLLYPDSPGAARVRGYLDAMEPKAAPAAVDVPKEEKAPVKEEPKEALPALYEEARVKPADKKTAPPKEAQAVEALPRKTKSGFFILAGVTRVEVGGNFDGKWALVGAGSTDVLPNLETATGFKLGAGYRLDSLGSLELSYAQSNHIGTYGGADRPGLIKAYSADAHLFITRGLFGVRPFASVGAGYITMDINDGSSMGALTANTKLKGRDLRLGGGVEVGLSRHVAVDAQGIYRWGSYRSVEGIESGDINGHVDGNGVTFSLAAKYVF